MAEEQKTTPAGTNAEAEKDVQNVLAELKSGETTEKKEDGAKEDGSKTDDKEAEIIAKAAELGQKSEKAEEKKQPERDSRYNSRGRGGHRYSYRDNNKFDPTTQEKTDDPVQIRKQVS